MRKDAAAGGNESERQGGDLPIESGPRQPRPSLQI